ncbi:MAG: hypothetical protein C5S52_07105 [ANME-2 cluster archaeon]|nr:hypothetical protein [ANME-2 cluster archaeon]
MIGEVFPKHRPNHADQLLVIRRDSEDVKPQRHERRLEFMQIVVHIGFYEGLKLLPGHIIYLIDSHIKIIFQSERIIETDEGIAIELLRSLVGTLIVMYLLVQGV